MGKDISNSITFDSLGSYTALIHNTQYYYSIAFGAAITPATQHIPPPTVHINLSVRTHAEEALSREYFPAAHTIVYRDLIDTLSQDSTHLNIHESDKGVVFYEDKNLGEDRLLIKKINLASWRAESQ